MLLSLSFYLKHTKWRKSHSGTFQQQQQQNTKAAILISSKDCVCVPCTIIIAYTHNITEKTEQNKTRIENPSEFFFFFFLESERLLNSPEWKRKTESKFLLIWLLAGSSFLFVYRIFFFCWNFQYFLMMYILLFMDSFNNNNDNNI